MANMSHLPLKASSKVTNIELGGPISINPFANAGVTAADAPVLLSLEADYVLDAEKFASRMVEAGGQGSEAQARLALNATESVIEDLVDAYGAVTVQTPFGTIETFVAGTLEHAQDQPDPATNYAFLGIVVPEAYRKLFASIETFVPAEAIPVTLKRVRDVATGANAIYGTNAFHLKGRGMNYGDPGTKLELQDHATRVKICDVTVDATTKSPIDLKCTLPSTSAVDAGTYWLALTAKVGGTLWPAELKVNVAEAVVPQPIAQTTDGRVKVMTLEDNNQSTAFNYGNDWIAKGLGLKLTDAAANGEWYLDAAFMYPTAESSPIDVFSSEGASAEGKQLTFKGAAGSKPTAGTYANAKISCTFKIKGGAMEDQQTLDLPINLVVS